MPREEQESSKFQNIDKEKCTSWERGCRLLRVAIEKHEVLWRFLNLRWRGERA